MVQRKGPGRRRALLVALMGSIGALALVAWPILGAPVIPGDLVAREGLRTPAEDSIALPATPTEAAHRAENLLPGDGWSSEPPAAPGTATLEFRLIDAASGNPLPDHPYRVLTERGGFAILAEGRTDGSGCAIHDGLVENLYSVETQRHPPHAPATGLVWVSDAERTRLEVTVGHGGSVHGRVINDQGEPLEGVPISLDPATRGRRRGHDRAIERTAVTHTDEEGRYRIDAVRSTPEGLWLDGDGFSAERWTAVGITAALGGEVKGGRIHVRDGEVARLQDLVIPRGALWHGRVLDHDGTPIVGALVSSRYERHRTSGLEGYPNAASTIESWNSLPGSPIFKLHTPEEGLSDTSGYFSIQGSGPGFAAALTVRAPDGRQEHFRAITGEIPPLEFGATSKDLILVVRHELHRRIEFRDPWGQTIDVRLALDDCRGARMFSRDEDWRRCQAQLVRVDGSWAEAEFTVDRDSGTRGAWNAHAIPGEAAAVLLWIPGFRLCEIELNADTKPEDPLEAILEPWDRMEFELRDSDRVLETLGPVDIDLILASSSLEQDLPRSYLGSIRTLSLSKSVQGTRMVAQAPGVYWLRAQSTRVEGSVCEFGPFSTGSSPTPIQLDGAFLRSCLPESGETRQEPPVEPPPSTAPVAEPSARIQLRAIDAGSGEVLPTFRLRVTDTPEGDGNYDKISTTIHGSMVVRVPPGKLWWSAFRSGFEDSEAVPVLVDEGETVDLGVVELEPLPRWRGRLLDAEEGAVEGRAVLDAFEAGGSRRVVIRSDIEGGFEFIGTPPDEILLQIRHDVGLRDRSVFGIQELRVRPQRGQHEQTVTMAPWRIVELRIHGHDPRHREAEVSVSVDWLDLTPAPSAMANRFDEDPSLDGSDEVMGEPVLPRIRDHSFKVLSTSDGTRVFHFASAPGPVRVSVASPFLEFEDHEFEVSTGAGPQVVDLRSR